MSGLTKVKDKDGLIYEVTYDVEHEFFLLNEIRFEVNELRNYIEKGEISIVQDGNGVLNKYLR